MRPKTLHTEYVSAKTAKMRRYRANVKKDQMRLERAREKDRERKEIERAAKKTHKKTSSQEKKEREKNRLSKQVYRARK